MSHLKSSREIISENFVNKKFFENFLSIEHVKEQKQFGEINLDENAKRARFLIKLFISFNY